MFGEYDRGVQQQFADHGRQIGELAARIERLAQAIENSTQTVTQLVEVLAVVDVTAPPRSMAAVDFDRQVDPSLVEICAQPPAALLEVKAAIRVVLDETALKPDEVELIGPPLGMSYSLRLKAASNLAAASTSKFIQLQRVGGA